jgi:hypothetical protein
MRCHLFTFAGFGAFSMIWGEIALTHKPYHFTSSHSIVIKFCASAVESSLHPVGRLALSETLV